MKRIKVQFNTFTYYIDGTLEYKEGVKLTVSVLSTNDGWDKVQAIRAIIKYYQFKDHGWDKVTVIDSPHICKR